MSDFQTGDKVKLITLNNSSKDFLEFLSSKGISLEVKMNIKSTEPFDSSTVVSYYQHPSETLSQKIFELLLVVAD